MKYAFLARLLLPIVGQASTDAPVQFNRDVRPILADACFACHGFDAKARKARLRLDLPEGAFAPRKGTVPIKPGDPQASVVWARINAEDAEEVMPPPHTHKQLTAAQKETIRRELLPKNSAEADNAYLLRPTECSPSMTSTESSRKQPRKC